MDSRDIPIPKQDSISKFVGESGLCYKKWDDTIIKLEPDENGIYNIHEDSITRVINYTSNEINLVVIDKKLVGIKLITKPTCSTCKHWDNSESETEWNEQHKDVMEFPYKEYGACNNIVMENHIFQGSQIFGNYTHKHFGCIFHEKK